MNASGRDAQHQAAIHEPFDATSLCTSLAPSDECMVVMRREVGHPEGHAGGGIATARPDRADRR